MNEPKTTDYKAQFQELLSAVEYTLSAHGDEDWLKAWIEGDHNAIADLERWVEHGKPN